MTFFLIFIFLGLLIMLYRIPILGVVILVLLYTECLKFLPESSLPFLSMGPGLKLRIHEVLLILMFLFAVVKLHSRREKPLFGKTVIALLACFFILMCVGIVTGSTDLDTAMGQFRILFSYVFYFIVVAAVNSTAKLRFLLYFIIILAAVSVMIQFGEALSGQRWTFGLGENWNYDKTAYMKVGGSEVLYLWNRSAPVLYLCFFLAFGSLVEGKKSYLFPVIISFTGFIISLVRQWYVFIFVGIIAMFIFRRKGKMGFLVAIVVLCGTILGFFMLIGPATASSFNISPLRLFIIRLEQTLHFSQEDHYMGRLYIIAMQWRYFLKSPIYGYGMSKETLDLLSADTGVMNSLVQTGILGVGMIFVLILNVLTKARRIYFSKQSTSYRGVVLGIIGLWLGLIVGYSFSWNFFGDSEGILLICLVMAILDRIENASELHVNLTAKPGKYPVKSTV